MQPLKGIRTIDLSTMLPGPLASLLLAEAGADVLKVERPGGGDDERGYSPKFGPDAASFALLNRGKRSITLDLKDPAGRARLEELAASADILVEQFRPGVMERLGLDYSRLKAQNPRLIYCSITGYGQTGEWARKAGHDLNYMAETGILALSPDPSGQPTLPCALVADIAGGAYPAVMNILLALQHRQLTGTGCHLDISITDNLFTTAYWALAAGFAAGEWPIPARETVTGGSPRYQIYKTADERYIAAAPFEDKFWLEFCNVIGLSSEWRDVAKDPQGTIRAVKDIIGGRSADDWARAFKGLDVCCSVVDHLPAVFEQAHFRDRNLLARTVSHDGQSIPALPVPIAEFFRPEDVTASYPASSNS